MASGNFVYCFGRILLLHAGQMTLHYKFYYSRKPHRKPAHLIFYPIEPDMFKDHLKSKVRIAYIIKNDLKNIA